MRGGSGPSDERPQERRVYRHRLRWVHASLGVLLGPLAAVGVAWGLADDDVLRVVAGLLQLLTSVFMLLMAGVLRVETSPEGLAYHNMGLYTVRAGWADVDRVERVPLRGMGEVECVILSRSTIRGWTGPAWALPKAERGLTIPLGGNLGKNWTWARASDLKRDVLLHAPHAAHDAAEPTARPR